MTNEEQKFAINQILWVVIKTPNTLAVRGDRVHKIGPKTVKAMSIIDGTPTGISYQYRKNEIDSRTQYGQRRVFTTKRRALEVLVLELQKRLRTVTRDIKKCLTEAHDLIVEEEQEELAAFVASSQKIMADLHAAEEGLDDPWEHL